ncbi:hypothetical protein OG21DRAFT_608301 [Imleria badia]|nr:hypothetical protein OG21DRAFT_608301 [Imleria badia]
MFPVDRICYQYSNNVRDRIPDEDLDGLASNELTTKMRITFEQRPFNWIIDVDNPKGIRCRDVFGAMYDSFNQQLTLEELWRVTNRGACEEAFRIRNLVLGNPQMEWSLGWKRVDVLLHHTIFHGLTMNPEGDLVLNLGAPLPVPNLPRSLSLSRRNSSSTEVESGESSDESVNLSLPATLVPRGLHNTGAGSAETSNTHPSPLIVLEVLPRQQSVLSRPIRRPLGPRPRRNR